MTQAGIGGYGDKEREFLDALKADTGRDLAQWMEAIRGEGLTDRNAIIDWLRRQGFRFSRASWLERVYHNNGQPIYAGRAVPAKRPPPRPSAAAPAPSVLGNRTTAPPPRQTTPTSPVLVRFAAARPAAEAYASPGPASTAGSSDPLAPEITALTAKAKAYRPLAEFLLREIAKAVPGALFGVARQQVTMAAHGREFAALAISARDLKLTLAGTPPVVLTDARQVDDRLLAQIAKIAGA